MIARTTRAGKCLHGGFRGVAEVLQCLAQRQVGHLIMDQAKPIEVSNEIVEVLRSLVA